jgi:hypothetical protein
MARTMPEAATVHPMKKNKADLLLSCRELMQSRLPLSSFDYQWH